MAVARMLKVAVIGHSSVVDEVVTAVQRAGVLEIVQQPFDLPPARACEGDTRCRELDEYLADAQFVRDFLGRHRSSEAPFSAFISEKIHLSIEEYRELQHDPAFQQLYHRCVTVADALAHNERERARLRALVADLEPWREFRLQIGRWRGTEHVVLLTGTVPTVQSARIRQLLRDEVHEVTVEELGPVGPRQAWVIMAHASVLEEVRAQLALTDFDEVTFPGLSDYPGEESAQASARIAEIEVESSGLLEEARGLASEHYEQVVALAEALQSDRDAITVRQEFGVTERAFVISGWVVAAERSRLEEALEPFGTDLDASFSEPAEDDTPPVELRNPRLLRPFEVLTDLYGRPAYRELDPTPLLAPFFLLFFSICISDFGYGAMLIVGTYLIKTRLDVAPGVKKFMDLLMMGGAGAMVVGVLFASYFALPLADPPFNTNPVARFLLSLQVLDPLKSLKVFLVVCIGLGLAQVFFGVLIAAYGAIRQRDAGTAILEQLSTIFLFAMIGVAVAVPGATRWALVLGLGLTMLMQGRAVVTAFGQEGTPAWDRGLGIGWLTITLGAIGAFAFTGDVGAIWAFLVVTFLGAVASRTVRKSAIAVLSGAYSVYGMSSFLGDVLSYTRLAALGLSGALVGWVFNILAGLVLGGAAGQFARGGVSIAVGVLIVLAATAVFVVGHIFNVVINLLGAFVHPARLQFVEFFSKFYGGGGREFAPFRYRAKNLVFSAGASRQEGGAES